MPKSTVMKRTVDHNGRAISRPLWIPGVLDDKGKLIAYVPVAMPIGRALARAKEMAYSYGKREA